MKEHALPQDVTGYKFHIIGNMTLKQFAEVAAGVGVGFIIYFTNLPTIIKWPLILIFSGVGALAAFVPFEERPLDHWIVTLFAALYRPTQFYWKRMIKIPEPFLYESKKELQSLVKEVDLTPARRQRVKDYLHTVAPTAEADSIDEYSTQRLNEIMSVFDQTPAPTPQPPAQPDVIPELRAKLPPNQMKISFKDQRQEKVDPNAFVPLAISQGIVSGIEVKTQAPIPSSFISNETVTSEAINIVSPGISVPEVQSVAVDQAMVEEEKLPARTSPQAANQGGDTYITSQILNTNPGPQAIQTAVQDKSLPFPAKPTQPNKLVGMAVDTLNIPLSGVIIEILTADNIPARAVKTNILGQFFITTPLSNGVYTISAEKVGYTFPPQRLELTGQVMDPIEIRSS